MNEVFTQAEISRAGQIVKQAQASSPVNVDAAIQSLMGPGSFDAWLGPKSGIEPTRPPRPGFWASLGRSAIGAADRGFGGVGLAPLRGFLGLAPGTSGLRTTAYAGPRWAWNKLMGNQTEADRFGQMFREGLVIPTQNARAQSDPYHYALSDWASREHPTVTSVATQPFQTLKNLVTTPPPPQRRITPPIPSWKQEPTLSLPKTPW